MSLMVLIEIHRKEPIKYPLPPRPMAINGGAYGRCYQPDHGYCSEYQGCNFCGDKPRPKQAHRSENLIDLSDYRDYQQPLDATSVSNGELSDYYHRVKVAQKVRPRPAEAEIYSRRSLKPTLRHLEVDESSSDPERHKNHDGVGSFETWDYVFQNLEKQGYSKDLVERDLLVQGLDLGSLKLHEERRAAQQRVKTAKMEPPTKAIQTESVQRRSTAVRSNANNNVEERQKIQQENSKNRQILDQQRKTVRHSEAQNEWSCRFCTYLNPDSRKICEMCSKSKDFFFSQDKTPTCV